MRVTRACVGLVAAALAAGCVEIHFTWLSVPDGVEMEQLGLPAGVMPVGVRVEGPDYLAEVVPPSSGTTWGLRGLLLPIFPVPASGMQSGSIIVPAEGCAVVMHLHKLKDGSSLTPGSLKLVVGDQSYAPSRVRVDGIETPDLLGPLAIGDKTWIVFIFDDPGDAPGEPFSLVLSGLPEMHFTPKKFTEWSVGR